MKTKNTDQTDAGQNNRLMPAYLLNGFTNLHRDQPDILPDQVADALERVMVFLRDHDTGGTAQLRNFVWSLWNGDHYVNLYKLGTVLDGDLSDAAAIIFLAYMRCMLREEHLRWMLVNSGEMRRFDKALAENEERSQAQPVDYPPTPFHLRLHCLELGPVPGEW
jgi:hypothetical protein